MSHPLQFVKSTLVTPAMLVASNVPETDYPAWAVGTTYAKDARVIVVSEHKIYQSVQAGNLGKSPATEDTWWKEVSATNRWKLLDLSSSTQTVSAGDIYYEIKPGVATTALCLLNMSGALSVRGRVTDPTFGVMYDKTTSLISIPGESGWYAWFFGERTQEDQFIALDLPSYPNAVIRIDVTGAPSIGVLMLGQLKSIGIGVRSGARVGIKDFSMKSRNEWGDTVLKPGAFADRASFTLLLANAEVDNVKRQLTSVRGAPCLFIGYQRYACTIVFGFYQEFDIVIPYLHNSECTIDIEGLT